MKRLGWVIFFGVIIGGWFALESAMFRRVNPVGRASTLNEYLAWRQSAGQFAAVDVRGRQHLIAYGPAGGGLLPSGPAAYVFDGAGRLVDWSADIGDDSRFDRRWNAQRSRGAARPLSRNGAQPVPASQPAA